jgi:hypothetical protein
MERDIFKEQKFYRMEKATQVNLKMMRDMAQESVNIPVVPFLWAIGNTVKLTARDSTLKQME